MTSPVCFAPLIADKLILQQCTLSRLDCPAHCFNNARSWSRSDKGKLACVLFPSRPPPNLCVWIIFSWQFNQVYEVYCPSALLPLRKLRLILTGGNCACRKEGGKISWYLSFSLSFLSSFWVQQIVQRTGAVGVVLICHRSKIPDFPFVFKLVNRTRWGWRQKALTQSCTTSARPKNRTIDPLLFGSKTWGHVYS